MCISWYRKCASMLLSLSSCSRGTRWLVWRGWSIQSIYKYNKTALCLLAQNNTKFYRFWSHVKLEYFKNKIVISWHKVIFSLLDYILFNKNIQSIKLLKQSQNSGPVKYSKYLEITIKYWISSMEVEEHSKTSPLWIILKSLNLYEVQIGLKLSLQLKNIEKLTFKDQK